MIDDGAAWPLRFVRRLWPIPREILRTIWITLVWTGRAFLLVVDTLFRLPGLHWLRRWVRGWADNRGLPPPEPWVLALIGLVVMFTAAFSVVLARLENPPLPPMLPVDPLTRIPESIFDNDRRLLFVTTPDGEVVVVGESGGQELWWCTDEALVASADGSTWDLDGRPQGNFDPLVRYPTTIHSEVLYLDATAPTPGPATPTATGAAACERPG